MASSLPTTTYSLDPPSLQDVCTVLEPALASNYASSSIEVTQCPDLRKAPFRLASEGLCGRPVIADIGGQPNLYPRPVLEKKFDMVSIAKNSMKMSPERGMLIGAGAGPFHVVGLNSELAPNLAWSEDFQNVTNFTHYAKIDKTGGKDKPACAQCPSTECALMMNLFGSEGQAGPVIKISARQRTGSTKSFTDVIRFALTKHFGDDRPVSMGGVFVIRRGKANFHIMSDFPPENELPWTSAKQLNDWLTYHDFSVAGSGANDEISCLSVFHSADPDKKMGLRMEHTHCFSADDRGGHYHYDLEDEEVEYEGYFNVAETIYRVDKPKVTLERDLHD